MKILYDESRCVRCGACATEAESGGIIFKDGKILVDENRAEDWSSIAAICPAGALVIKKAAHGRAALVFSKRNADS